jgi:hypothetical protein
VNWWIERAARAERQNALEAELEELLAPGFAYKFALRFTLTQAGLERLAQEDRRRYLA